MVSQYYQQHRVVECNLFLKFKIPTSKKNNIKRNGIFTKSPKNVNLLKADLSKFIRKLSLK